MSADNDFFAQRGLEYLWLQIEDEEKEIKTLAKMPLSQVRQQLQEHGFESASPLIVPSSLATSWLIGLPGANAETIGGLGAVPSETCLTRAETEPIEQDRWLLTTSDESLEVAVPSPIAQRCYGKSELTVRLTLEKMPCPENPNKFEPVLVVDPAPLVPMHVILCFANGDRGQLVVTTEGYSDHQTSTLPIETFEDFPSRPTDQPPFREPDGSHVLQWEWYLVSSQFDKPHPVSTGLSISSAFASGRPIGDSLGISLQATC